MDPINVYFAPRSFRIALGEEDGEKLVNYIFHAMDNLPNNGVLKLKLSDVDVITYSCLMSVIRRLSHEMSKGGKYHNKYMVIQDLPRDIGCRKEMIATIEGVIEKLELPILLIENATNNEEFKVLGKIFSSTPYLVQVYNLIREEEKKSKFPLTPGQLAEKLNQPVEAVSRIIRRLHSFRLLIREHSFPNGKTRGEYYYITVVARALGEK